MTAGRGNAAPKKFIIPRAVFPVMVKQPSGPGKLMGRPPNPMLNSADPRERPTGVILAGGQSRRFGGEDKGLQLLGGRPLVEHVMARLAPQVGRVVVSANRHLETYTALGVEVIPDSLLGYPGPLAGIQAALTKLETGWLLTTPCDNPFLPRDLARRLLDTQRRTRARLCVAHDGSRLQPLYALVSRDCLASLTDYLESGQRRVEAWFRQEDAGMADFSDGPDDFINLNTPEDLARAHSRLLAA